MILVGVADGTLVTTARQVTGAEVGVTSPMEVIPLHLAMDMVGGIHMAALTDMKDDLGERNIWSGHL